MPEEKDQVPKNISKEHIASKRRVGKLHGRPVLALVTTGGLHLLVCPREGTGGAGGGLETLGVGPHAAVARFIAENHHKGIEWTELNKSDPVPSEFFQDLLPYWEGVTEKFQNRCK